MGERESRKEVLDVWMLLAFSGYMFVGGRNLYSFLLLLSLLRPGAFYWYSIVGVENGFLSLFYIFILVLLIPENVDLVASFRTPFENHPFYFHLSYFQPCFSLPFHCF